MEATKEPRDIRLGVVRGISYGLFGPPDVFVPQARALGARLVRAYVYWGQVEPEPGRYTWEVVDALLRQLDGDQEVWITVCSSSPWATRTQTGFLPSSPALDLDRYQAFVGALAERCRGRVRYWQCDNEPSNTALLWAGTAEEYVRQLRALHRTITTVDPTAAVVLGGCGYDVFSSPEGSEPRRFFDAILAHGRDAFDLFDVHLYGDPECVPEEIETGRRMMRAHGYEKPVVAGEYNGPAPYNFPEAGAAMQETMLAAFSGPGASRPGEAGDETPERRAMAMLYERMASLPPTLQMFMAGRSPELDARRYRMSCRGIVARNLFALSMGVRRTVCWNLGPEVPNYDDPLQMMHLLFSTFALLGYDEAGLLRVRHPTAEAFCRLAGLLEGATAVHRVPSEDPDLRTFEICRRGRPAVWAFWYRRDGFDGEEAPGVPVTWPWGAGSARAVDVFGNQVSAPVAGGRLAIEVSVTPVFVTAA